MKFFIRIIVVLSALVLNEMAVAQYMNDGSSLYSDTWGDSFGVWGYGQLVGRLNIHKYAVDVKITSPKGRVASTTGMYSSYGGTATSQTDLPWDLTDLGTYAVQTTFRGWCSKASLAFTLALLVVDIHVDDRFTYYQTPTGGHGYNCVWHSTACTSGVPSCANGLTFGIYAGACPAIVKATYGVIVVNGIVEFCSPVGLVQTVDKAGPCT